MKGLFFRVTVSLGLLAVFSPLLSAQNPEALYKSNCASCHDTAVDRAPSIETLSSYAPERVLASMEFGTMISMANRASTADRRALAEFIAKKPFTQPLVTTPSAAAMCAAPKTPAKPFSSGIKGPVWNGWGKDASNSRYQENAGLKAGDVPKLKLKWAFGFPGDISANSQPVLVNDRIYIGSQSGLIYSLDAPTGCVHWYFQADASVRTAVTIGQIGSGATARYAAFFGDFRANAYAIDAMTGQLIWKTKVDDFPVARITGSPGFHDGRLYVPVSSGEEGAAASSNTYECCRFRGSLSSLDAATGRVIWKTYTVDEPKPTTKNAAGAQLWGPSGVPIWSSPTIDPVRKAIYVTTGNNYTEPATKTSAAFLALDMETGKIMWTRQTTENDTWNSSCRMPDKTNCPKNEGPDFDYGASPILVTRADGKRVLVAGQKSAIVYAIDPDREGAVIWQTQIGKGGTMGGVQWGSSSDSKNVYVALSDVGRKMLPYSLSTDIDPFVGGGMFAIQLEDGFPIWKVAPESCGEKPRCSPAQSAATTAIPGVAFSGSVDGHMRAYAAADGKVIWDFNTIQPFETVNKVPARGGSLDGPGPAIGGGMVFFNSGYAGGGGQPGNVLLGFSVNGK